MALVMFLAIVAFLIVALSLRAINNQRAVVRVPARVIQRRAARRR